MTEIISAEKLSQIVCLLLTNPASADEGTTTDAYAHFMTQIAQAVCNFYDSDVAVTKGDVNAKAWFVAITGNRLPQPADGNATSGIESARLFWQELLDSFESLTAIADQHGARTLADLFYLQNAVLNGSFIDHCPDESGMLEVVRSLFSSAKWQSYIKLEYLASANGHLDFS